MTTVSGCEEYLPYALSFQEKDFKLMSWEAEGEGQAKVQKASGLQGCRVPGGGQGRLSRLL